MNKKITIIAVVTIILAGVAVYGNSLGGEFIWDDNMLIKDNVFLRHFSYLPAIFTQDIGSAVGRKYNFYRPLPMASYMLDFFLWDLNVAGIHSVNMLLHCIVALTLYWLTLLLFKDRILSLITSLLFVVHPIHTETVSYMSGRADSLAAIFLLLSFAFYIQYLSTKRMQRLALTIGCYALALLSKENSIIFPALLLLYHVAFKKKLVPRGWFFIACLTVFYVTLRITLLQSSPIAVDKLSNLFQRIPGVFVAITRYIGLLLAPFRLHIDYGSKIFSLSDPLALTGIILTSVLLIGALWKKKTNALLFFSVFWFFLSLVPVSNLYPVAFYMAEHYLYLPSIGFFLIVAQGFRNTYRIQKHRRPLIIVIICLLAFFSLRTMQQNNYWKKAIPFYERTLRYEPDSARMRDNLGLEYYKIGKKEEALASYRKAIEVNPDYPDAYNNIGVIYFEKKDYKSAIPLFKKSIQRDLNHPHAYYNLAAAYIETGKAEDAVGLCKKALLISPFDARAHHTLGRALSAIGKQKEAIASFKKALTLDPEMAEVYTGLGLAYSRLGNRDKAILFYKKSIALNPSEPSAHNNLGILQSRIGKYSEALVSFKKALEADPQRADIYNNLGLVRQKNGNNKEAINAFKKSIAIDAAYEEAYGNLGVSFARSGQNEQALSAFRKAMELNPGRAKTFNDLGSLYAKTDRIEKAIDMFKKALEINPRYAQAHRNAALAYYQNGQYDAAIAHLDKAVALGYNVAPELRRMFMPYRKR